MIPQVIVGVMDGDGERDPSPQLSKVRAGVLAVFGNGLHELKVVAGFAVLAFQQRHGADIADAVFGVAVDQVARSLGVDRRTLHRHLAGHGETWTSVLHAVRRRLAERYLAQQRQSLTDISGLLGFAAPSAFSRWFREQYGVAPGAWRSVSPPLPAPRR